MCLTGVSVFVAERHSTVWTYYNLFLHLPVDGYLVISSFELLWIKLL